MKTISVRALNERTGLKNDLHLNMIKFSILKSSGINFPSLV